MSRLYRIRVSESLTKVVHIGDAVATDLAILPILGPDRMRGLLAAELAERGFAIDAGVARREDPGAVTVTVDLASGRVSVEARTDGAIDVSREHAVSVTRRQALGGAEERVKTKLHEQLERDLARREAELHEETTRRLEGRLRDLREEMDRVTGRVTIEALKERARELGEIEELSEDPATGELTIKVRV